MTIEDYTGLQGLDIGSKAPPIKLTDVNREIFDLEQELKSHSGILIDFFRAVF